ncbi:MAG: hypothetical protein M1368_07785 [Thaumarchaeota archaeon]|nr:hypothetical protein [Nitrososphaerota archaeon]
MRDGAMATALVLEALATKKISFSNAVNALPKFYQKKAKFECPNDKKKQVMSSLESANREGRTDRTDGLKIWPDENTWILLRPSGTEPLIRVYAESNDATKLERMYDHYQGLVKDAIEASPS